MLSIAYDREESTEITPRYYVWEKTVEMNAIIYKGSYSQCLCIIGAFQLDPDITLKEIRDKTNGFV